ncbi:MAG TPA: hypothetical protein VHZ76_00900 [Gammaproteobacteria bacterium]|jgi:hypothetical protein|nr:hypothetical protein [Gammaproteobacteria bacterium]
MDASIEETIRKTLTELLKKRERHVFALTQHDVYEAAIDHRMAIVRVQKEISTLRMKR